MRTSWIMKTPQRIMEPAGHAVGVTHSGGKLGTAGRTDIQGRGWYKTWYRTGLDDPCMSVSDLLVAAKVRPYARVPSTYVGGCVTLTIMHDYAA